MESDESSGGAELEARMGGGGGSSSTGATGSRWNPTKEQISMLEKLYSQGVRTPNADQIQQITTKLRDYGQIEGKNVFYWFQNHKARQRQRQKLDQQNAAFLNRFLHVPQPPLRQNVACAPYYLPHSEIGFYPQHPNVIVPGPISPRTESFGPIGMARIYDGPPIYDPFQQRIPDYGFCNGNNRKTLDLFPQHPTGTKWEGKTVSADCYTDAPFGSSDNVGVGRARNLQYFDFFTSGKGSRVSD